MIHKLNVFLLSLIIALMPAYVFANTSLGGWTITSQIAQGASTIINATKSGIENGVNIVKTSTAKITPNASQVAKILRGGAYGYAISVALEQILGFTVDWVLDPANNRISYVPPGSLVYQSSYAGMNYSIKYYSLTSLCSAALQAAKTYYNGATSYSIVGSSCRVNYGTTGAYDNVPYTSSQEQEQKRYVSLDTIASQVISNAESSTDEQKKAGAQAVTTAAAQDMLANDSATQSDVETQLNTNAKTQTSEQASAESTPKDPAAPEQGMDIKITFPVFCTWAPSICQAANVVINFPNTLTNWWNTARQAISTSYTETKEWLTGEPDLSDTDSSVDVQQQQVISYQYQQHVSFGASCPFVPETTVIDFGIASFPVEHDFTVACDVATQIRPYVQSISHLGALIYLIYAIRNGNG